MLLLLLPLSLLASVASSHYREQDPPTTAASVTVVTVNNCCCYQPALLTASSVGSDEKPDKKFSQGFTGDRAATGGRENESQGTLSCSLSGGPAGSFNGLEGEVGLGAAGGWSAHHFGDAGHRGHEQDLGFAPDTSEAAFGGWSFLVSCCP